MVDSTLSRDDVWVQSRSGASDSIRKGKLRRGFALASELAKAKDLQEVLRLQSNFAQQQMQSYARQAQELGRLMAEATRSVEPKG
jgi:hypothetical protein